MEAYTEQDALTWYREYEDQNKTSKHVSSKFGIKHETMLRWFKKLNLTLRPPGFRAGNNRGSPNEGFRHCYLWLYKLAYKTRAKRKNLDFTLTEDDFVQIVTSPCLYCGTSAASETRRVHKNNIPMLTVDRVDSSKGYVKGNCVPACKTCNIMKLSLPLHLWIEKMRVILDRWDKNLIKIDPQA